MLARVLEENGISTVTLNMFPEVAEYVIPPRTLQTKFAFGAPFGDPNNKNLQVEVIKKTLELLQSCEAGVVEELPYKWQEKI